MLNSKQCFVIFEKSIAAYHVNDSVDQLLNNPFPEASIENLLFRKNWIDTVQWHLEDIIREPSIDPVRALIIKRRIDTSNQERTDLVEVIDNIIFRELQHVKAQLGATINTETPGWAIDRLSILALKIYHMNIEANREDADEKHRTSCNNKLQVLLEQKNDMFASIDQLLEDLTAGRKKMKLYKQMKMYNDPALNPVLYKN
ncbi:MAG: DUF4254 domain-containing protein [Chitinophagaceae bacterium]|nr:DUF4254 domain-containing protein [Chitinophagaceae bacterium]